MGLGFNVKMRLRYAFLKKVRYFYLFFKIYSLLSRYNYRYNYKFILSANVAELVDALDLGSSRLSCESSSLSIRTTQFIKKPTDYRWLFSSFYAVLPVSYKNHWSE
ncbi:MAG: hypothetical protein RI893_126 [Pseudomonadota bacterium]